MHGSHAQLRTIRARHGIIRHEDVERPFEHASGQIGVSPVSVAFGGARADGKNIARCAASIHVSQAIVIGVGAIDGHVARRV